MAGEHRVPNFSEKRFAVRAALERGMGIVYQPIVDIRRGTIVGVEALARFADRTPDAWFADAWSVGLGLELEIEAIRRALVGLDDLPPRVFMSVNAAPETIMSHELENLLASVPGDRIVVEITEHDAVTDYAELNVAIARLRARGVQLAIDDVGAGFSSFQHVLRLRPDKIKLDRSLTNHVDENPVLAALAAAMVTFAGSLGARICAEGIETVGQLVSLQKLGIPFGQGYFLAKPGPLPLPELPRGVWTTSDLGADIPSQRMPSPAVLSPARLDALYATKLLDSAREEDFDCVTRLASKLLGVPIALVSLVDDKRQFFKSAFGLPDEVDAARETPLSHSFCQHTVTTRLPLIVDNALEHPLVRDNGAVADLDVIAYLGVPLITSDDHVMGAFCAISHVPRKWSSEDLELMKTFAATVTGQVEVRAELARRVERDALYRQVMTQACNAVFVGDIAGRIKVASAKLCDLLGRSRGEVEGERLRSFIHPSDLPGAIELHRQLLTGELQEAQAVVRVMRPGGDAATVRFTWKVLRHGAGRACLSTGIMEPAGASIVTPARRASQGPVDEAPQPYS